MTVLLKLFCLIDGESTSNAFELTDIAGICSVSAFKMLIKAEKTPNIEYIATNELSLWQASIPVATATKHNAALITGIDDKEELLPTDEPSDIFGDTPAKPYP
ncbi:hypothetical protein BGX26_006705, partial [Mortierella sp. AD094]